MLNDLEGGRVERRRDPADRRRHIVVTDGGRKATLQAERAMEGLEDEVLGALAPEERDVLRGLLARALAADPAAGRVTPSAGGARSRPRSRPRGSRRSWPWWKCTAGSG